MDGKEGVSEGRPHEWNKERKTHTHWRKLIGEERAAEEEEKNGEGEARKSEREKKNTHNLKANIYRTESDGEEGEENEEGERRMREREEEYEENGKENGKSTTWKKGKHVLRRTWWRGRTEEWRGREKKEGNSMKR